LAPFGVDRFLASRDEAAFRSLYRQHTPYLWALAVRLCRSGGSEAEEVVQEAWVRGVRLLPLFVFVW
jgi:DNA-directed RNA polymerase specialized sigma24 family protein